MKQKPSWFMHILMQQKSLKVKLCVVTSCPLLLYQNITCQYCPRHFQIFEPKRQYKQPFICCLRIREMPSLIPTYYGNLKIVLKNMTIFTP